MRRMSKDLGKAKDREIPTTGVRYEQTKARNNIDPNDVKATSKQVGQTRDNPRQRGGKQEGRQGVTSPSPLGPARNGLRYRKVDKRLIGAPTDFRYVSSHHPRLSSAEIIDISSMPQHSKKRRNCCFAGLLKALTTSSEVSKPRGE